MKQICIITIIIWGLFNEHALCQNYPFNNPKLDTEKRIDNILSLLTLEEKINCLSTNPTVPRLNIKGTGHVEGLHGLAMGVPGNWGKENPVPTTTFPQSIGMGQTWDTTSMRLMGEIEGYEVRYMFQSPKYNRGGLVVRAPNADLGRDPRWGRTEECYGEDPFLNGTMAVAFIKGLQGHHPKYWQAASLIKHFLANSNEDSRTWSSSNFNDRLLREYYALPFQMGIEEGGARAFMASYNKVNETPMMVNPLLRELTINEWGLNGIICTDGGALKLLISDHKYYSSIEMGAAMAVKYGINQFLDDYKTGIKNALEKKIISEPEIDAVLRGVFRVMIKLGMLDPEELNPYAEIGKNNETEPWKSEKNKRIVREVTQKSIVLLKNDHATLPLNSKKIKSIVIVGKLANEVLMDWYGGSAPYLVTPLEGIKSKINKDVKLSYFTDNEYDKAIDAASTADVVIVFGGNHPTGDAGWAKVARPSYGKESVDRETLNLEDEQWIKELYEVNQNIVMVLVSSFPYAINWSQHNLPAILQISHNSQEHGNALADVIFGDFNPGGRLVQSWPVSDSLLLPLLDYDIRNGNTYLYSKNKPLYPFGYGLSYTKFEYANLQITPLKDEALISFEVKNTGNYDGDEVVQIYVSHLNSQVTRPKKELKGFARKFIKKGETIKVAIPLKYKNIQYWDSELKKFVDEKNAIVIKVGTSSEDIRLKSTISID